MSLKAPPRLTTVAQRALTKILRPGDLAVDATMGNGHDTAFLWHHVRPTGHVVAMDVQARALMQTRQRLLCLTDESNNKAAAPPIVVRTVSPKQHLVAQQPGVTLIQDGHENLSQYLSPSCWQDQVSAVMFNLGYLPGSFSDSHQQRLTTRAETTVTALDQAARTLLRPGGIITILAYPGHNGGAEEVAAVEDWILTISSLSSSLQFVVNRQASRGPILYLLERSMHK